LILVFTNAHYFLDDVKRDELARYEGLIAADAETGVETDGASWQCRLVGYSTTAGALRERLKHQDFSKRTGARPQ